MKLRFFATLMMMALMAGSAQAYDLRIVTLKSPPLSYSMDGEVYGALTDVLQETLRRMDVDAKIDLVPWVRALEMVQHGEADAIYFAIWTDERSRYLIYPKEPLWYEETVAIVRHHGPVSLKPDMSNAGEVRLGVGRGYYYGVRLENLFNKNAFASVEDVANNEDNIHKLLQGRIDAFLTSRYEAVKFLRDHSVGAQLEIVSDEKDDLVILDVSPSYLAFSRKTVTQEFVDRFSGMLNQVKKDGTYRKIMTRYRLENIQQ